MSDWEIVEFTGEEYTPSENDILAEQLKSQTPTEQRERSFLEKVGEGDAPYLSAVLEPFLSGMDKYAAPVAGGLLQGVGSTSASIGNLALMPFTDKRIPQPDLKQYLKPGLATDIGYGAGELGGYLLGGSGAAKGLTKALQASKVPVPASGMSGILADILKGGAIGGAVSEGLPGGRLAGSLLGGAFGAAGNVMPSKVGRKVLEGQQRAKEGYRATYQNIFNDANASGVASNLKIPSINSQAIKEAPGGSKVVKAIDKFKSSPTLENAHKAQSDLGRIAKKLNDYDVRRGLNSLERSALEEALLAQKKIRGSIFQNLSKDEGSNLAQRYQNATLGYARDVGPYLQSRAIQEAAAGQIPAWQLPFRLNPATRQGYMFSQALPGQYPQIPLTNIAAAGTAGLGAGSALAKYLLGE